MQAKVISVAQSKGGVGKSTVCANLAVTFSQSAKVLMVDCDPPQYSLSTWFGIRAELYEETGLDLEKVSTPGQLINVIDKNKACFDYIIVDGAPHVNATVRAMLLLSNMVVMPLAPSSVEIWSFKSFDALLDKAIGFNPNLITRICWNRVRRRVKSSADVINSFKKHSSVGQLKKQLTFRVAYMDSFAEGCSVYEWNDSVASAEIWSLSSAVKRLINRSEEVVFVNSAQSQAFIKKG